MGLHFIKYCALVIIAAAIGVAGILASSSGSNVVAPG